jgi:hypothetical protein
MTNPWAKPAANQPKASISMPGVQDEEFAEMSKELNDALDAAYQPSKYQPPKRSDYDEEEQEQFADSFDLVDQSNSEVPAHVVVLSAQDENWEDDGGDHDPFTRMLTPTQLRWLDNSGMVHPQDPMWLSIRYSAPEPTLPAMVERVETVWTAY